MPFERAYGPTEAAPRCETHGGAHAVFEGHCLAVGAQVRRPFTFRSGRCDECGTDLDLRRDARDGRLTRLTAGTDTIHHHAPTTRVALDEDRLAEALADAFEEVRRRRERPAARPQQHQDEQPPMTPPDHPSVAVGSREPREEMAGMAGVRVWVDDGPA